MRLRMTKILPLSLLLAAVIVEWLWRMEMLPLLLLAAMMGRKHWVAVKVEMLPLSLLAAVTGRRHG